MSYTIDEKNMERQQLLAQCLNPLTIPVLGRVPRQDIYKILDLGCGQGNTTRLLAEQFPGATLTGLDYDENLVAYAKENSGGPNITFQQGDASKLPFPDASFDLVFARYLLVHMPDPSAVIAEMFRVLRPGGHAVSFEPDCCMDFSYPHNPGLTTITYLFQSLFAQPQIGRQLVHRFRAARPASLESGAILGMEADGLIYKRIYHLTAHSLKPAIEARSLLSAEAYEELTTQMASLEASPDSVVFKLPDMWVVATR